MPIVLALLALLLPSAALAGNGPLLLDIAGDGLDLSGAASTELLGDGPQGVAWTTPGTDDCFLMVDATRLRDTGYRVLDSSGQEVDGIILFRDGLRVAAPGAAPGEVAADGRELLAAFDADASGRIDSADPVFGYLWLFMDEEGDGALRADGGELHRPETVLLTWGSLFGGPPYTDPHGNQRSDGVWEDSQGAARVMSLVVLAPQAVVAERSSWGELKQP